MNISDELERIMTEMELDEKRKMEESNTAKSMALLADGGSVPQNDLISELKAQMYGSDPANTKMPEKSDLASQFIHWLSNIYFPGLVAEQANVPTAAQGDYSNAPSHAKGGSIGFHQPGALEDNMLALGGHKALPIIMALHKAMGGKVELPKLADGGEFRMDSDSSIPNPPAPPSIAGQIPTGLTQDGIPQLAPITATVKRDATPWYDPLVGAADVGKTLLGGAVGMVPAALETGARLLGGSPMKAEDIYAQALSHYTPDLMTQSGKNMGEDLASFMERNKIPLALPELLPFEEALGSGASEAIRKSNQVLKALEPEAGTLGSNLGNINRQNELLSHSGDNALPLKLPRANLSDEFINNEAERVAKQMLGEHVTRGKAGDTKNLAGRSMKESERVKGLDYKLSPTGTVAKEETYVPRKGDVLLAFPGDQTVSNKVLEELNGSPVNSIQEGGAYYGLGQKHLPDPEFWKSTEGPAKNVQGKANRIAEYYEPERVIGSHLAMGPTSNNFAMHLADANIKSIDWSKVNPSQINMFDRIISNGYFDPISKKDVSFPEWPGLANPEAAMAAMKENSALRKWFNSRFKTPAVTKVLSLPNGLDVQYAITEPRLRDMEINMTGLMNGVLKPNAPVEAAGNPHNTYSHRILGEAIGPQEALTPFSISFPDAAQHIASTKRPSDFTGTIQKVFPHQVVDDQYVNQYNQYLNRIKQLTGRKKGGKVKDLTEDKE